MKLKISLLASCVALVVAQSASGALLIGYNTFSGNTDNIPNAAETTDFSGSMVSTGFSTAGNGSTDGYYGPDGVSGVAVGSTATNGRVNANGAQLTITNTSLSSTYTLSSLLFDMTTGTGGTTGNSFTNLTYEKNSGGQTSLLGNGSVSGAAGSGAVSPISGPYTVAFNTTNYSDFLANLAGITLAAGDSIVFRWTAGTNIRLDNVALIGELQLSAIPEPGSLLALGGLLGAGCVLRSRRRPVTLG